MRVRVGAAGVAAAVAMCVSGCAQAAPLSPEVFLGETMEQVAHQLGERDDLTRLTQDVSVAVGREPQFTGDELESTLWTVVAACADADDMHAATVLEVAVIPTDTFTPAVARQMSDGEFGDAVSCLFDE